MDAATFDRLARSLTALPTRRTISRLMAGTLLAGPFLSGVDFLDAEAKKRKRRKRRKKKKKGCTGGTLACGGKCCDPTNCIDDACCPADRLCGTICCAADQVCGKPEAGLCVVGQGTCPSGADSCDGNAVACNSPETCGCFQSVSGATRCGQGTIDTQCGQCTNDAACGGILGEPGAFCAKFFGSSCPLCEDGQNACLIPCPS